MTADELASAAGTVRCGNCGKTYSALTQLFDDLPELDQSPVPASGLPPLLEDVQARQSELPINEPVAASPESVSPIFPDPDNRIDDGSGERRRDQLWGLAAGVLALACLGQLIALWQTPGSALARLAGDGGTRVEAPAASEAIQIASRDMHRHPTLDDAIIISVTLKNQSEQAIAYPVIDVRLFDPSQQVLGARRLGPEDYLSDSDRIERGMAPGLVMPVILEFVVGTTEPSGFDFRFH